MKTARSFYWLICAALLGWIPKPVYGQNTEWAPLPVRLQTDDRFIAASFDVTGAFNEEFRERLNAGLQNSVLMKVSSYDTDNQLVGYTARQCELRYDLWTEVVTLHIRSIGFRRRWEKQERFILVDDAFRAGGNPFQFPIVERASTPKTQRLRIEVTVSLNPTSEQMIEETREFMSNPGGGSSVVGNIFYSVAKLFQINPSPERETFKFQSPWALIPYKEPPP